MKRIAFYKDGDEWFADVPEYSREDNQMVAGADTFLDLLSTKLLDNDFVVAMNVSDDNETGNYIIKLVRKSHDDDGATYVVTGQLATDLGIFGEEIWLCNVMHTVMGCHPESIYIHSIEKGRDDDLPEVRDYWQNGFPREMDRKQAEAIEALTHKGITHPDYLEFSSRQELFEAYKKLYLEALYLEHDNQYLKFIQK